MPDVPFALAIGAGMVAAVNPCGFAMLPAYLGFFVGVTGDEVMPWRGRTLRALVVSAAMTAGFVTVFAVVGFLVQSVARSIDDQLSKVTVGIGGLLILLGGWLLTGHSLRVRVPALRGGGRDRSFVSMYVFGLSYATASLSCTLGPFLVALTPTFRHSGTGAGILAFLAYAAGMALVVTAVTVALASAQQVWVARLRALGPVVDRISGALLVLAGSYVVWYGAWELRGGLDADPVVDRATSIQEWLTRTVAGLPRWPLAGALVVVVGSVLRARRSARARSASTSEDSGKADASDRVSNL